ncbi:MAG: HypC/HybG/HupF family hydrogenase formation chaperone [Burkholderiales bacterium]|nr:HypC/HybG/HupF family hydrogenase formation chaperone [Burkholderiales bacterium]
MCIGIPLQVIEVRGERALALGRGGATAAAQAQLVDTRLLGPVQPGDWLLVFLGSARERLSAERAAEINATLDLLATALAGGHDDQAPHAAAFALPSALSAEQLAALTGGAPLP